MVRGDAKDLIWHNIRYEDNYWKSKIFTLNASMYLLVAYTDMYDIVRFKDGKGIQSASRRVRLIEVDGEDINLGTVTFGQFEKCGKIVTRVGKCMNPFIQKRFVGYTDDGLKTLPTELEPTYDRRRYTYTPTDGGEVIITLNTRKILLNVENCSMRLHCDSYERTTPTNKITLGDFLKRYVGNVRVYDIVEVPGKKTLSGPYMKKVRQLIFEGKLTERELGTDILDRKILDKPINIITLDCERHTTIPYIEITLCK